MSDVLTISAKLRDTSKKSIGKDLKKNVRIYRGGFLLIQFIFLLGINTYGWRQAGVNHVLIFEINPRNNLSHQHLFEVSRKSSDCFFSL